MEYSKTKGLRKNSEVIELIKRSKAVVSATKLYDTQAPDLLNIQRSGVQ